MKKLFSSRYRFVVLAGIGVIVLAAVGIFLVIRRSPHKNTAVVPIPLDSSMSAQTGGTTQMNKGVQPASIKLSEGKAQPQVVESNSLAEGQPLSDEETQALLARLPTLVVTAEEQVDFKLAQEPLPPPRAGQTVQQTFPPEIQPTPPVQAAVGPLEVLRHSPEGEISVAPFISVTFNQPMVPLTTLADLAALDVPVKIEPSLPGTWRWVGTKTLTFQNESDVIDRLPKATLYQVSVPAGTQSVSGGVLAESVEWTFTTPPPKVISSYPVDIPQPLEPIIFIAFDQRIDPSAVLAHITLQPDSLSASLRLATEEEIQTNEQVSRLAKDAQEGRWLALKPAEPLPPDTGIIVDIGAGTPSAEGPLVTMGTQSFRFQTYAPLRIEQHGCSYFGETCQPLTPFYINFNNPIDLTSYQEAMLTIQPEVPGAAVSIYDTTITIQGATQGQTTYTVQVSKDIQDIFGQKLGKDTNLTFKVGSMDASLVGPDQSFVTVDPTINQPVFTVYTINYSRLAVKIYAVQPSDWPAYKQYLRDYQQTDKAVIPPGSKVFDKTISIEAATDTLTEVDIDLKPYLDGKFGHFVVVVNPPAGLFKATEHWRTVQAWVQVTQIALDAFTDHSQMVAWVSSLKDGAPLPNVTVSGGSSGQQIITGEDGTATFPIPEGASYLVARQGADQALLPASIYLWDDTTWQSRQVSDELRWYVFDDRQMYKPGEEVHIKGWLRRIGGKQNGDISLVVGSVNAVNYRITEPQGNEIGSGRVEVNALGGFDLVINLPIATNLGYAQVYFTAEGSLNNLSSAEYYHSFQIQEFRRPEFEVNARNETAGPYFAGGQAIVAVEAKYYAGDALPNADVNWLVTSTSSTYSPPNWPEFTFGTWQPWWWSYSPVYYEKGGGYRGDGTTKQEGFSGRTDASGTHYLQLDISQFTEPNPVSITAEATVMDVNRQTWASSTSLLVHPADVYVGLRSERYFVQKGTPLKVDFIVTDLDGNPVPDRPVELTAARLEWKQRGSSWSEEEVDVQTCSLGSGTQPVTCTFQTPIGGTYRITALVTDDQGRRNKSQFTRWVSGGQLVPARKVEQETVTLIPDKETYQPGDTAQILVQSPFSPAEGLLTVNRSGIIYTQRFQIEDGTATLSIPIEEQYIPNINIQIDLTGSTSRVDDQGNVLENAPKRPAYAVGQLTLKIPPLNHTLSVEVTPAQKELAPGQEATLSLQVKDAEGNPAADAEVAVVVVDEAILALTNYQISDPVSLFYTERGLDLSSFYSRASIILVNPLSLMQAANQARDNSLMSFAAPQAVESTRVVEEMVVSKEAGARDDGSASTAIKIRSDFNPLAAFLPSVHTDGDGRAQVTFKLPDNLTRYRVMVVAVHADRQFGTAETNLTARLPLMVRLSAPRFLNFGDQFELPVVLQNQTDDVLEVNVAVRASNLTFTGSTGLRVTIRAHDRVEVRFPAATDKAGTATIQVAASAGEYSDAASAELPVYTPATTEAFATYGVLDEGAVVQPVAAPTGVFPQYGGLEINTSSTALQTLTDAVLYLVAYPYECSEQLSSRILAVAALRDVLTAFQAEGLPAPAELEAAVQRDITRLQGMQNDDGGLPYWRRSEDSIPYNTIHAALALQKAKEKGYTVPDDMQQRLLEYLRQIENYYPEWYSQHTRQTLSANALYVRTQMGETDTAKALRLISDAGLDNLDLDAVGWLWQVLKGAPEASDQLAAIRLLVNNRVVETAGAANFTTSYDDQSYLLLNSDRRTDAILLDALINDNPQSDLIPKVVTGLLAHRTAGRWSNTQENVFVLLAMDRYFNTFEAQTPDFIAKIWLGEGYAGSHTYQGRTTERQETMIPMQTLLDQTQKDGGTSSLLLDKEGTGRLYYRLGLTYAPTDLELPALDMGFVVQRTYEALDDPDDVTRDENGIWHIKAGARVRVRLTMVADNRRYHVALVDPLPAGLEIVNPALAVSGSIPQDPNSPDYRYGWWWWGTWYEHQNLRDERAEAFTPLLWDGVYQYTYIARATTPGRFVVPPAKAEEMYSPEVFGRSSSNIVVVE
jgi:uncharacterized protein YfaS (alpha-2-macroglobulin family)